MYDKIKFWIDRTTMAVAGTTPEKTASFLEDTKEHVDLTTGEVKYYGRLEGLKVSVFRGGVSVVGSLPKYLNGNNVALLDRHGAREALKKMGEALHVCLDSAKITSLEFGATFTMQHPVEMYLDRLGEISKLIRYRSANSTLYYRHKGKEKPKELCFYDKGEEQRQKGVTLPMGLADANLLRYEIRYNGKLPRQIGCPKVEASTLTESDFYRLMVCKFQNFYFSIVKLNQVKTDVMAEIKTVTDAYDVFVARLISQGGQCLISDFVDELKAAQVFQDRKNYTRLKNKIQEISTKARITITDDLIKELDDEIQNVGAYA